MKYIEIKFWQFVKWVIYKGYGYCRKKERMDLPLMSEGRCAECDASDVQDWIDKHIELIKF